MLEGGIKLSRRVRLSASNNGIPLLLILLLFLDAAAPRKQLAVKTPEMHQILVQILLGMAR